MDGWGWLGWLVLVTPEIGGEQGVNKSHGGWLGKMGGCSGFQNVVRIRYDGFLWGFGVETPDGYQSPGQTILGGSRGGGQFGTGLNWWIRWEIGVDGVGGRDTNGVGCWLNGWVGVRGGF
jgi:hypothetical protein